MIKLTKLSFGPFERPVPPGLNELLQDCWRPTSEITPREALKNYNHEVIERDGRLITLLTPK